MNSSPESGVEAASPTFSDEAEPYFGCAAAREPSPSSKDTAAGRATSLRVPADEQLGLSRVGKQANIVIPSAHPQPKWVIKCIGAA